MRVLEGKLVASGLKVGIVAARFNDTCAIPLDTSLHT